MSNITRSINEGHRINMEFTLKDYLNIYILEDGHFSSGYPPSKVYLQKNGKMKLEKIHRGINEVSAKEFKRDINGKYYASFFARPFGFDRTFERFVKADVNGFVSPDDSEKIKSCPENGDFIVYDSSIIRNQVTTITTYSAVKEGLLPFVSNGCVFESVKYDERFENNEKKYNFETKNNICLNIDFRKPALCSSDIDCLYNGENGEKEHKKMHKGENVLPISRFFQEENAYFAEFEIYDHLYENCEDESPITQQIKHVKIFGFAGPKNPEKIKCKPEVGDYIAFDNEAVSIPDCKAGLIKTGKYVIVKEPIILCQNV